MRRGLTIIELLVVIGVIALLIGILLPFLGGARSDTGAVASLANLRSIGQTVELHLQGNRTAYPFAAPGTEIGLSPPDSTPFTCRLEPHWYLEGLWPALLHDTAPWSEHFATWLSPGSDRQRLWPLDCGLSPGANRDGGWVSYRYANSFIALPSLWSSQGAYGSSAIQETKAGIVAFPSSKVLMFDADRSYLSLKETGESRRPLLFADGSASLRLDSKATPPVTNPLNWMSPRVYHDTPGGVTGRDF